MKYSLKTLTNVFFTRHTEQTHTHTGDLNRARIASQSLSARRSLFDARLSLVRSVDRHLVSRLLVVVVVGRWFNVKDKNVIKAFTRHCQSIYSQQRAANEDDRPQLRRRRLSSQFSRRQDFPARLVPQLLPLPL